MEIINLDMTPSTVTPNAHAGQYDASRTVRFMLKNGGVPFTLAGTETITAEITRSDNTEVTVNVANTSSNYVDVVFDDTVCTVKGLYACELRLKDSDGFDIGSKNFALLVQRDPYDGAGIHVETVGPADICTFETTLAEPLHSVLVNVEATGGNGTPDNPNPINGYSAVNLTACGVNLWDEQWVVGGYNNSTGVPTPEVDRIRNKNHIPCKGGVSVYITYPSGMSGGIYVYFWDSTDTLISVAYANSGNSFTFTTPANTAYFNFNTQSYYGATYNDNLSFNYPSTDTTYHPYTGNTYTIAFGQTVYGGVPDVTRGKLHVTYGKDSFSDKSFTQYSTGFFAITDYTSAKPNVTGLCEIYTVVVDKSYANAPDNSMQFRGNQILIKDTSCADVTDLIARTGSHEFIYELSTPFDIDLTPEVISAVVGENNVFAGCGQTTVKYLKAGE